MKKITFIVATVALSSAALTALTVIATRRQTSTKRSITITSKEKSYTFNEETRSSGPPSSDEIEKIGKALSIDLKTLMPDLPPGTTE